QNRRQRQAPLAQRFDERAAFFVAHFAWVRDEKKGGVLTLQQLDDFAVSLVESRLHPFQVIEYFGKRGEKFRAENSLEQFHRYFRSLLKERERPRAFLEPAQHRIVHEFRQALRRAQQVRRVLG